MTEIRAEMRLPTGEPRDDLPFFTGVLKMRLDMICPADDPEVAVFPGRGSRVRVEKGAPEEPGTLRIPTGDPYGFAGGVRWLHAGDASPISPGMATRRADSGDRAELLEVTLPGRFVTEAA